MMGSDPGLRGQSWDLGIMTGRGAAPSDNRRAEARERGAWRQSARNWGLGAGECRFPHSETYILPRGYLPCLTARHSLSLGHAPGGLVSTPPRGCGDTGDAGSDPVILDLTPYLRMHSATRETRGSRSKARSPVLVSEASFSIPAPRLRLLVSLSSLPPVLSPDAHFPCASSFSRALVTSRWNTNSLSALSDLSVKFQVFPPRCFTFSSFLR